MTTAEGGLSNGLTDDAIAVLERWTPVEPEQQRLRQRYVGHLYEHRDGVWRDCLPDHLTAGALVLSEDGSQVLLNLHRKAQEWFAFGGHCEPGDASLAGVAAREAREESGIDDLALDPVPLNLSEHAVPFCSPGVEVHHLDVRFLAIAGPGAQHRTSEESLDVRWWPLDGLPELLPDMVELIATARERLGQRARTS